MKLGHIGVSVKSIKRSSDFYRRHFGLVQEKEYSVADKGMKIAILRKGDLALELFEFKKHKPLPKYRRTLNSDLKTLGVKHFSVEERDIKGVYRKLKKAKVNFETDLREFVNGARYFFIKDPDGILIEVMEAK